MPNYLKTQGNRSIPVQLTESEFNEFILDHILARSRGPQYKVSHYKIFNLLKYGLKKGTNKKSGNQYYRIFKGRRFGSLPFFIEFLQ